MKSRDGSIICIEEEQLALLRNLRFKQFLIAVVARTLETIIGRKVDLQTVAFSPDGAKAENNSLVALVAHWVPVVETVLAFVVTRVTPVDFAAKASDDIYLDEVVKPVASLLYAGKASAQHLEFAKLVTPS